MNLIIDGSNIKDEGGGLIHLMNLINFYQNYKNVKLKIFSSKKTLDKIHNHKFIEKKQINYFVENNFVIRLIWQKIFLNQNYLQNYDILITLGGISFSGFKPSIVLCQNLLPFSKKQYSKYNFINKIKLLAQSILYCKSFNNASGVVYMTEASRKIIEDNNFVITSNNKVIHHGNDQIIKNLRNYSKFNKSKSFKLLYVSRFQPYKNHFKLIECFDDLTKIGFNLKLTLIFPENDLAFVKIKKNFFNKIKNKNILLKNNLNNFDLSNEYKNADCFIYPSECESFGIPLVEAASFSLPIVCTKYSVFKEILGDSANYFDIKDNESIKKTIINFYENIDDLQYKSSLVYKKSKDFSWDKCMNKYNNYIKKIISNEKI